MNKYRSEIITKFVNIETIVNTIITVHYLGKNVENFLFEVLYDELFSFGLKRRILIKARKDLNNSQFIEKIGRLNTIRNIFAHCGMEYVEIGSEKGIIPSPKDYKKSIDPDALYKEFMILEKRVAKELIGEFNKLNIKVFKDIHLKEEITPDKSAKS